MNADQQCNGCLCYFPEEAVIDGRTLPRSPGAAYCLECAEKIRIIYSRVCQFCGVIFTKNDLSAYELCSRCKENPMHVKEYNKVIYNISRATQMGLPDILTIYEWQSTLEYFNYRCAYCGGPYQVFEHFVPLSVGGGTTVGNCVPSCSSCNSKKGKHHPDDVPEQRMSKNTLDRVRKYLESMV